MRARGGRTGFCSSRPHLHLGVVRVSSASASVRAVRGKARFLFFGETRGEEGDKVLTCFGLVGGRASSGVEEGSVEADMATQGDNDKLFAF